MIHGKINFHLSPVVVKQENQALGAIEQLFADYFKSELNKFSKDAGTQVQCILQRKPVDEVW